ncbi:hypothetical protein BO78DRAFT_139396 [Aspergillus sclerotiicarbonarius CBS 121057]|uniref:Uncharacterized protein n=1 Tax=Aspergillus sclerotiicarbonarius (strain CBS 121057 / IBT 28362) TaxID=1448318 RepID=A0A319EQM1_ASPSB|nr:hypothetical protein BO78DRAFT_139396 [Aspergillus sclerotiicarbonarius CBS 121057]
MYQLDKSQGKQSMSNSRQIKCPNPEKMRKDRTGKRERRKRRRRSTGENAKRNNRNCRDILLQNHWGNFSTRWIRSYRRGGETENSVTIVKGRATRGGRCKEATPIRRTLFLKVFAFRALKNERKETTDGTFSANTRHNRNRRNKAGSHAETRRKHGIISKEKKIKI